MEVRGTALTPQEWQTHDVSNIKGLKLAAVSNFNLLRDQQHTRKCKKLAIRLSYQIAQRENNISGFKMHIAIQSLLNELSAVAPLKQYDLGSPDLVPTNLKALHWYVSY